MSLLVAMASLSLGLGEGWVTSCNVDEFTDAQNCRTSWTDTYRSRRRDHAYILTVSRVEGRLEFAVLAGGTRIPARIDVRVDGNQPAESDRCPSFGCILGGSEGERIVAEMRSGEQLRVRLVTSAYAPELEVTVPLAGFSEAMEQIQ